MQEQLWVHKACVPMAGWGQGSSEQQLWSRLASQRVAKSLLGLDKVLCWHGYAAPRFEVIHVKPAQSTACAQLLQMYLLQWPPERVSFPSAKVVKAKKKKKKQNLAIPPVPVLKTLPAFHKINRRETFCRHLVCFSSIHFHLPSEICAFLLWQHSYL